MWRIFQFSYKQAWLVISVTLALTVILGLQVPNLKIKVSADELIPEGSELEKQYESVSKAFGSDEVSVIYAGDEALFTRERLLQLKELNNKLAQLPCIERVESLFTVSNINGSGGWIDTTPLLERVPVQPKQIQQRMEQAISNPILNRNVISNDGKATTLSLYLRPQDELIAWVTQKIERLDAQIEVAQATTGENHTAPIAASPATMPTAPGVPSAPSIAPAAPAPKLAGIAVRGTSDIESLIEQRDALLPYLDKNKYAETIYYAIEKELAPYRDNFGELFQIGSPTVQVQMTDYILKDQKMLLPLSMVALVVLIGFMLRSVQGAIIPVINAVIATAWTLGTMALLGVPINMLNYIVPALILVIGATEDVHVLVEYKEILARGWRGIGAITDVGHNIGLTLALTGMTTVLGFAAAGITDIKIMRDFAITAALGMFARFIVSVVFLPAYLRLFGRFFKPESHEAHQNSLSTRMSEAFTAWVMKYLVPKPYRVLLFFGLITIPCLYFATNIKMSNDLLSFLKPDSPLVQQLNTLSENLSGTKVIYLTVEGNPDDFRQARKVQMLENITRYLRELGEFDSVVSLSDYLALVNREMHESDPSYFHSPRRDDLLAQYLLFFHPSMLSPYVTGDYSRANIVIRCNINDSHKLNLLMEQIRQDLNSGRFGPLLYTLTGKSVMVAQSVENLSKGQTASIAFMALALFIIIATLFISFKAAAMTVISNLWTVVVLFGIMGAFDIPLNVGTCMVAAITIGIGIDDTLHLMVRYNKDLKQLKSELPAIERVVKVEFMPVIITSIGLAGGFGVLASSSFVPVMQFGALSAFVIFLAVIADLILTPVLLSKTRLITLWDLVGLNVRKALMSTSPVFRGMNTMQAKKLILASNVEEFSAGTPIVKAGEEGDEMYVILEGDIEVSINQNGNRILISYLSMGEVFGEIALISRAKRTADVIAKTDTKLLVYDWDSLVRLRRYAPYLSSQLLLNLASILGLRLVDAQRKLDNAPKLSPAGNSNKRKSL